MSAALAELHIVGEVPDTLRFQRFEPCVLIGRSQEIAAEVRLDRCGERSIALARRLTGGGAVYMDAGVLSWQIVAGRKRLGIGLAEVAGKICSAVAAGLSMLGATAEFSPPNAIVAAGRKLGGASGYFEGATLVHEGTVLVDVDFREMFEILRRPGVENAADLARHLTSLTELLGEAPPLSAVKSAIATAVASELNLSISSETSTQREKKLAAEFHDAEFGTDRFVFGEAARVVA
jgi:lipoate-protein ligase A